MKARKYRTQSDSSEKTDAQVKEASARYGRRALRKAAPNLGVSLAVARKRVLKPAKRSAKDIRWALGIVGIGKGPKDLSENLRAYLRREK